MHAVCSAGANVCSLPVLTSVPEHSQQVPLLILDDFEREALSFDLLSVAMTKGCFQHDR